MAREPLTFYRLWCGRRRYSGWMPSRLDALRAGVKDRITFDDGRCISLGPLAWIEVGHRKYARSRTIPVSDAGQTRAAPEFVV